VVKVQPRKVVIATGAYENMLMFPNNDLPGVYGAGAVQTLMNVNGVLPGERVLMVGAGNIGLIVSYQLMQAGAKVVAVVEGAPKPGGWDVHAAKIKRMGVPILCSHTVLRVDGDSRVAFAVIAALDANWKPVPGTAQVLEVDTVCLAVGLSPFTELLSQAGCPMVFSSALGGYVPRHNPLLRTEMPGFYIAGDASGVEEASAAMIEGRIAGLAAASDIRNERGDSPEPVLTQRLNELQDDLASLRRGPMGKKAREGKNAMWRTNFYSDDFEPNTPPPVPADWRGAKAVIECSEFIPCDPCVSSCPTGAITMKGSINDLPEIDVEKCTGCGICVGVCPGLAIFLLNRHFSDTEALLVVPFELIPLPNAGDEVFALDRLGSPVCKGRVVSVRTKGAKLDRRALVSFAFPAQYADVVRHFSLTEPQPLEVLEYRPAQDEDPFVCRCEDIRRSDIVAAIHDGLKTVDELRRVLRLGMGPCQGKTCGTLTRNILAAELGGKPSDYAPAKARSPLKALSLGELAEEDEDWHLPLDRPHGGGH
jgi:thioredoxin reductase/ferredoxin